MLTPVPPSDCQRARESVSAQLDGELSELGTARLSAHLRECEACTAYALEVSAIANRLRAAPLERPGTGVALPVRRRRAGLQIAAAAAVAVAAASSLALGHALVRTRQLVERGSAALGVAVGLGRRDGGLAEQVERGRYAAAPHRAQLPHGRLRCVADDEAVRHVDTPPAAAAPRAARPARDSAIRIAARSGGGVSCTPSR